MCFIYWGFFFVDGSLLSVVLFGVNQQSMIAATSGLNFNIDPYSKMNK